MNIKRTILSLLLLILPLENFAAVKEVEQNCAGLQRLDSDPSGSMYHNRYNDDQGGMDICNAYVGATLIDALRTKISSNAQGGADGFDGAKTSPLYLSLHQNNQHELGQFGVSYDADSDQAEAKKYKFKNEGGEICDTINGRSDGPLCAAQVTEAYSQKLDFIDAWKNFDAYLKRDDEQKLKNICLMKDKPFDQSSSLGIMRKYIDQDCAEDRSSQGIQTPKIPTAKAMGVEDNYKLKCASFKRLAGSSGRDIQRTISRGMELGLPVGLGICANFFFDTKAKNLVSDGVDQKAGLGKDDNCVQHAVTVVGRRPSADGKKCQYLVRNSWGTDACQLYDSKLLGKDGKNCDGFAPEDPSYPEPTGNVWVDDDKLIGNTTDVDLYYQGTKN